MKDIFSNIKLTGFKTIITAVVNIVVLFLPGVGEWIAQNSEAYGAILSAVIILLRSLTSTPIASSEPVKPIVVDEP